MKNLKSQGTKSVLWDMLGKFSNHGISFLVTIILARILDPSDFGLVAIIMVFVGVSHLFTDVGLSAALIQKKWLSSIHYSSAFYFNVSSAVILTCITYLLADNVARYYQQPILEPLVQTVSLVFILNALSAVHIARFKKQLTFAPISVANVISAIASGSLSIILAFNGFGVWSLVGQVIFFSVLFNILIWTFSRWRPKPSFSLKSLVHLWKFGFRMFISSLLDAIYSRLDYLIIGKLYSTTTLGHFQIAKQFNLIINHVTSGSLMEVLFPTLSKVQNQTEKLQSIVERTLHLLSYIVFLLIGLLYCSANEIITILYSTKWSQSAGYMSLLLLTAYSYPLSALFVNILKSRGNSKQFLRLEIIKKGLHTINLINLIYYGINEYLYGLIFISFFGLLLNILFASREIKLKAYRSIQPILVQMGISVIAYLVADFLLSEYKGLAISLLIFKSAVFSLTYISLSMLLQTKSSNEFNKEIIPIVKYIFKSKC